MPAAVPEPVYDEGEIVRRVPLSKDYIAFKRQTLEGAPSAFRGETLAIRPLDQDGTYGVFFAANRIATIDLTKPQTVGHLSEQVSVISQTKQKPGHDGKRCRASPPRETYKDIFIS